MAPFLILHGYQGSGPGHWQHWLAGRLAEAGADVVFPRLPSPDAPELQLWLRALDAELDALSTDPVVICHSLGCLLWLHHRAAGGRRSARLLLVAPPSRTGVPDRLDAFFPVPLRHLRRARLVCSDDDAFCPEGALRLYANPLGLPTDVIPGGGHLNPDAGYGPWPSVEAWCRRGSIPITR
jgi:predicted alpha/beta hydrolase family esterase